MLGKVRMQPIIGEAIIVSLQNAACALCLVKAFLAQAKEEFNKKWDEAAQVGVNRVKSLTFF